MRLLKKQKKPQPSTSRMSFGGASTSDEYLPDFPISVQKPISTEPAKVVISDVVDKLIELGHGSVLPKKQLVDEIRKDY